MRSPHSPLRVRLRAFGAVAVMLALFAGPASASTPGPSISSINPSSGSVRGGEQVTINGSGFAGSQGVCAAGYDIWFGTDLEHWYAISARTFQVLSDTQIRVTVPANFGGPVDVRVHNVCGTSPVQPTDRFSYQYPSTECLSGTCSLTISSSPVGSLGHVALGFLDGFNTDAGVTITPGEAALVRALHPRQWRLGQAGMNEPWGGLFALAKAAGARVSLDLTSD